MLLSHTGFSFELDVLRAQEGAGCDLLCWLLVLSGHLHLQTGYVGW